MNREFGLCQSGLIGPHFSNTHALLCTAKASSVSTSVAPFVIYAPHYTDWPIAEQDDFDGCDEQLCSIDVIFGELSHTKTQKAESCNALRKSAISRLLTEAPILD